MLLHNICKNKKWGEIFCEHDWILKFAGFLGIPWVKSPFWSKKGPPKNNIFKKISFFQYFLSPEALSNSSKVQLSKKTKKIRSKSAKKIIFQIKKKKKKFFLSDFLEFLIFFLSWTKSAHSPLFSALQLHWLVHNQRFSDFSKKRFFCLFLDPST